MDEETKRLVERVEDLIAARPRGESGVIARGYVFVAEAEPDVLALCARTRELAARVEELEKAHTIAIAVEGKVRVGNVTADVRNIGEFRDAYVIVAQHDNGQAFAWPIVESVVVPVSERPSDKQCRAFAQEIDDMFIKGAARVQELEDEREAVDESARADLEFLSRMKSRQ